MALAHRAHVLLACALLSACSSHYKPARSPRVSVVMQGGNVAYERDGETHSIGFMGNGLVEAVEDDPEAREAAETFRARAITGVSLMIVGTACLLGGMVLAIGDIDRQQEDRTNGRTAAEAGLVTCGIGGLIGGSVVLLTAQPYQYDAVNIYNDNVDQRRMWYPPPPPWTPQVVPAPQPPQPAAPPPPAPSAPTPADAGAPR